MTKIVLQIDDALCQVEMLAERAGVRIDDLDQGYIGQNIKDMDDAWMIMPHFMTQPESRRILQTV